MTKTFLYFAYGSNLLQKRIHINNPTAVRRDIGRLENYRLDFWGQSKQWRGAAATIVPTPGSHVWGAIWEIGVENLEALDYQENVHDDVYFPFEVDVTNPNGKVIRCRVYQKKNNPKEFVEIDKLPEVQRPSLVYLKTIIKGAEESGFPKAYIDFLKTVKHNNYAGEVDVGLALNEIESQ